MESGASVVRPIDLSDRSTSDWRYFVNIVRALAVSEFKLRYFGSVLGYFWTLARPLLLFGVLYVVFTHIVRFGANVPNYALVLLTSIVMWQFFADATSTAVNSLANRESLVRKMSFPLAAIPVANTLTAAFNFVLNLIAVFVFMAISGISPQTGWLEFPLVVLGLVAFAIPTAALLAILYVRYRDMQHIWEVALQLGFWGSPIIYTIEVVPKGLQKIMMCNPISVLLEQARHSLFDPTAPTAAQAIGGTVWLLIPLGIFVCLAVLSYQLFKRQGGRVAELL